MNDIKLQHIGIFSHAVKYRFSVLHQFIWGIELC